MRQDGVFAGLVYGEVEAHVRDHADDAGQPAPPQRQDALLRETGVNVPVVASLGVN